MSVKLVMVKCHFKQKGTWALFSSKIFCKVGIVTLSFVFDKYCLIMN